MYPPRYYAARYFLPSYYPESGSGSAPGPGLGIYFAPAYFPGTYDPPSYFPGIAAGAPVSNSPAPASPLCRLWWLIRDRGNAAAPAPDLLAALVAYLRSVTPLVNALGHDPWGNIKIYMGEAPAFPGGTGPYPLLLIADYKEDTPGESLDDEKVELNLSVIHTNLDSLRSLSRLLKNSVDSIADNPNATRVGDLSFEGGQETGVIRYPSTPYRVGKTSGANFIWREDIEYEFWVTPDQ